MRPSPCPSTPEEQDPLSLETVISRKETETLQRPTDLTHK